MISDVFLDHLPPTRLVQWIHNATSSSRLFVSSPNFYLTSNSLLNTAEDLKCTHMGHICYRGS